MKRLEILAIRSDPYWVRDMADGKWKVGLIADTDVAKNVVVFFGGDIAGKLHEMLRPKGCEE